MNGPKFIPMHIHRFSTVLLALTLTLSLSSCNNLRKMETDSRASRLGAPVQAKGTQAGMPPQSPVLPPGANPPLDVPPVPPITPPKAAPAVGIRVPGKSDIVRSPYSNDPNALVNVHGLPPGTEVQDPYTAGRTFLVP